MKLRKVMAWTLASAMFAGLLAGCGGSTQTTETAAAESGSEEGGSSAEGGKVLRYQASTLVDSLDPALSNDYTSSGVISQFMMGLMTKDESGAPVYGVAESEEKSEDGLTLTFKIRDDAKWSNGDPVTANFVYAWRRVADPATASDYQFFITTACIANAEEVTTGEKPVEELGVEAAEDKTLVVTLSSPCAIFDYLMASGACFLPLNQKFVESCGGNFATSADTLLADGPFKVSSYEPSAMKVELVKNDQFFGASDVKLDGVEFSIITDSQTAALSFENGDLDVVTLSGNLVEQYEDDPRFSTRSDGYNWYLTPNMKKEGLDNVNIRKALAKSYDKEAITTRVLKDGSTPMDYFVPQGLATNEKGEDFREAAGSAYDSWTYDVEAAKELWKTGLGELGKDSLSFTLMCEDTDSAQAVAQFLQSEWQNNLPGLTIDRYADFLVCQILSAGAEFQRELITQALRTLYPECSIYERSDVAVRKKEGLKERTGVIYGETPNEPVVIEENGGVKILVDIRNGHKTGFYLDQRDNRQAAAKYTEGKRVLNCFCYTGGFWVYALKGGAKEVVNVDLSQNALDIARQNAELNGLDTSNTQFVRHDVFKLLREYREKGEKFDVIVLDPPKFAESKAQLLGACRGYKDINMLAFQLLAPGGVLLTYSCSGLMEQSLFQKIVADAALDAGRDAQILELLSQASDHPIGTAYPEGFYLKGLVVRAR